MNSQKEPPEVAWNPRTGTVWVRVLRRHVGKQAIIYYSGAEPEPPERVWTPVPIDPPFVGGGGVLYRRDLPDGCVLLTTETAEEAP